MATYWRASRAPRYSLLFALPLLVAYEILAALQPVGPRGSLRNGADVILELLFRVVLVTALAWLAEGVFGWLPAIAGLWAVLLGAIVFSAVHYLGPYGDRLTPYSFIFRMIAGVFFSALYVMRGFGITAWTHALYDVALLVR